MPFVLFSTFYPTIKTKISFHTQGCWISSSCPYNLCPDDWDEDKGGKKDKCVFWPPLDLDQKLATSGTKTNRVRIVFWSDGRKTQKWTKVARDQWA